MVRGTVLSDVGPERARGAGTSAPENGPEVVGRKVAGSVDRCLARAPGGRTPPERLRGISPVPPSVLGEDASTA